MARRPRGYGLSAEISKKINDKYDLGIEREAREWMEALLGRSLSENGGDLGADGMHAVLKDGVLLCQVMNCIQPGSVKKINETKMAFKQMENISHFLASAERYGCSKTDMFQTVDLFEKTNMVQVVNAIHALGRMAQKNGFEGPGLGPKESHQNKRDFSEETLRAGNSVIGLQAGSNKGASQSGMNLGKSRSILD
ncbi:myophilin-like [Haliotis rubra]|uniref:myophilin-like n=1 Tax=Haliotis rubra TaxID=36100 RepID=UPI001EE51A3B|nr:myophilin-like [Haliotis rubra]